MGIINIEGLGDIQIQGDTPTQEESRIILKAAEKKSLRGVVFDGTWIDVGNVDGLALAREFVA